MQRAHGVSVFAASIVSHILERYQFHVKEDFIVKQLFPSEKRHFVFVAQLKIWK